MGPDDRRRVCSDPLDIQLDELLCRDLSADRLDDLYEGEW